MKTQYAIHSTHETSRAVETIVRPPGLHMVGDGFRVHGYFSARPDLAQRLSPFLLLDYHPSFNYPATDNLRRGVGVHPHRGFETVTLAFAGSVAHHDSAGNGGVIGPGDVQWMTAASGILHREYHAAEYARSGGPFHMAQLWVNLPRAHKMDAPSYQGITADRIAQVALPDGAGRVRVIAGEYAGEKGPARTHTPIDLYDVELKAGGQLELSFPAEQNLAFLVMKGELAINEATTARTNELVVFANRGEHIQIAARADAQFLVLGGEPIHEPIVQYGPFVMNTPQEIEEAITDFSRGKFGALED